MKLDSKIDYFDSCLYNAGEVELFGNKYVFKLSNGKALFSINPFGIIGVESFRKMRKLSDKIFNEYETVDEVETLSGSWTRK